MKKHRQLILLFVMTLSHFMVYAQNWDQCFFNRGPLINKAPMPEGRAMMASSVIDGKIFTTCGYYDYGTVDTSVMKSTINVYDPVTDTWDIGRTPIPYTRCMPGHGQSVVNGKWYVVGGLEWELTTDGWMVVPFARMDVYDPQTDNWELKASLPEPKGGNGICVLDGKIYVTGGISGLIVGSRVVSGQYYKSVYMYDPDTDTWMEKADMNSARAFHTTIACDGKIYAFGGNVEITDNTITQPGRTAEVYDPKQDLWTPISQIPFTFSNFRDAAGCVVDNAIYLFGGNNSWSIDHRGLSQIIKYNPEKDQWSEYGHLPFINHQHSICAFGKKIYIVGGRRGEGQVCGSVEELEIGDVVLDELIPDTSINLGDSVTLDLSQHFSHMHGEPINYSICFTIEDYISGSCNGNMLTLYGIKEASDYLWVSILAASGEDQLGDKFQVKVTEAEVTGIPGKDPYSYMFHIFPNPAEDRITIHTQNEETHEYTIYSLNGQKLLEGILTGSDPGIDISMLEKGLYLISINNPERSATNKFIKLN